MKKYQSKLELRCRYTGHFENDVTENQKAPTNIHKYYATEVDIQSRNPPKKTIWPPGGHFESDATEYQKAFAYGHYQHACEIWNWNPKANLNYATETVPNYATETMPPTGSRKLKISMVIFANDVAENQ